MSRAKSEIDFKLLEKLCIKWPRAVLQDIHLADILKVGVSTLKRAVRRDLGVSIERYREQKERGYRQTLVQRLEEASRKGNLGATIWLTKNVMIWSDKTETKETGKVTGPSNATVFNVEFGDGTKNDT